MAARFRVAVLELAAITSSANRRAMNGRTGLSAALSATLEVIIIYVHSYGKGKDLE